MTTKNIFKITILSILLVALTSFLIFMLVTKKSLLDITSFNVKTETIFDEKKDITNINNIYIESQSKDIIIKYAEDDQAHIVITGTKKEKAKVEIENDSLIIETDNEKSNVCIGICFIKNEITLYLPESYKDKLDINTTSGDVKIEDKYKADANFNTTSGDISIKEINNSTIKTTSGDITIDKLNNLEANTTSGDINIIEANDLKLYTTSGDLEIDSSHNLELKTVSGDININESKIDKNSNIKTTSGDVTINNIENDICIETETTSGDIKVNSSNRLAEILLKITTTSGDIKVN